jgi:hypothetical protein
MWWLLFLYLVGVVGTTASVLAIDYLDRREGGGAPAGQIGLCLLIGFVPLLNCLLPATLAAALLLVGAGRLVAAVGRRVPDRERLRWLQQLLNWYYRKTPVMRGGQDATATDPKQPQLPRRYEINVSRNGQHVFATDSTIRNYHWDDIVALAEFFRTVMPDCQVSVMAFSHRSVLPLPDTRSHGEQRVGH